jgi:hypothetical protein
MKWSLYKVVVWVLVGDDGSIQRTMNFFSKKKKSIFTLSMTRKNKLDKKKSIFTLSTKRKLNYKKKSYLYVVKKEKINWKNKSIFTL